MQLSIKPKLHNEQRSSGIRFKVGQLFELISFFYCMFPVSGYHMLWFDHINSGLLRTGPVETGELAREIMS